MKNQMGFGFGSHVGTDKLMHIKQCGVWYVGGWFLSITVVFVDQKKKIKSPILTGFML